MQHKIFVIGLTRESAKIASVEYAEETPSLFDLDKVIANIDSVRGGNH